MTNISQIRDIAQRAAKFDQLYSKYLRLQTSHDAQRAEIGRLRAENRELRQRLHDTSREMRLLREAYEHAHLLIALHSAGLSISRNQTADIISQRKWERAIGLLRTSRLIRAGHHCRIIRSSEEAIVTRLGQTFDRLAADDRPLTALRARMPKHNN